MNADGLSVADSSAVCESCFLRKKSRKTFDRVLRMDGVQTAISNYFALTVKIAPDETPPQNFTIIIFDVPNNIAQALPLLEKYLTDYDEHLSSLLRLNKMFRQYKELPVTVVETPEAGPHRQTWQQRC